MPAPLPPQATPGNVVGEKYVLDAVIGRGGMGVVLSARHTTLGKRVAVKLLTAEADDNARARFELEAQAAALIASPHIAQVLDFGVTRDGLPFLVMEYLEGRDLQVEKKLRVRLPIAEAVDVVLEASVGVAHAHAAGLVHRDIKPANVFLADVAGRRVVKILDFGLIKVMSDGASALTGTTETFGTPRYMAPEQLRSARSVDARADQHALAAILFEMITGRPPFDGESVPDIIIKIGTERAPLARDLGVAIPEGLEAVLQRAMAKRPDQRFPSLAEFARAVAPFGSARAPELATDIERCLANTLGRRPVLQDELRITNALPAFAATAPTSTPTFDLAGTSGPGTLSSSSVESVRAAAPAPAPPNTLWKIAAVSFVAAAVSVASLVYVLQRSASTAPATPGGAPSAVTTISTPTASAAQAPSSTAAPLVLSAPIADDAAPSASPNAAASAAPSANPTARPAVKTTRPTPPPTATQKPCASLDCLR